MALRLGRRRHRGGARARREHRRRRRRHDAGGGRADALHASLRTAQRHGADRHRMGPRAAGGRFQSRSQLGCWLCREGAARAGRQDADPAPRPGPLLRRAHAAGAARSPLDRRPPRRSRDLEAGQRPGRGSLARGGGRGERGRAAAPRRRRRRRLGRGAPGERVPRPPSADDVRGRPRRLRLAGHGGRPAAGLERRDDHGRTAAPGEAHRPHRCPQPGRRRLDDHGHRGQLS